jgi:hypothetical protein
MPYSTAGDAYCRVCQATFEKPLPQPYGAICPDCFAGGHIVTLTDAPPRASRRMDRVRVARAEREALGRRVNQGALAAAVRELRSPRASDRRSIGRRA